MENARRKSYLSYNARSKKLFFLIKILNQFTSSSIFLLVISFLLFVPF